MGSESVPSRGCGVAEEAEGRRPRDGWEAALQLFVFVCVY